MEKKIERTVAAIGSGDTSSNLDQRRLKLFSAAIKALYVALAALTVLWEFMLLSTALYFHDTSSKIGAGLVAVFFWFITYRVWYRQKNTSLMTPCSPGDGFMTFGS